MFSYDMILLFPWQYVSALREQIPLLSRVVAGTNKDCRVIFGLPTYKRSFVHDHGETFLLALKSVREGGELCGTKPRSIAGIALFADYTTDDAAWKQYENFWLAD